MDELNKLPGDWKELPGYPGYWISSRGEAVSFNRPLRKGKIFRLKKFLYGDKSRGSLYWAVSVYRDGKSRARPMHQLVLETFVGPRPSPKHQGAHLNGKRLDNSLENLAWVTAKENEAHKRLHGTACIGEKHHSARLTEANVLEIRSRYKQKNRTVSNSKLLGEEFGVSQESILNIIRGRTWTNV